MDDRWLFDQQTFLSQALSKVTTMALRIGQLMLLDVVEFERFSHTKKTIVSGDWVRCDSKNVEREKQADFVCDWVSCLSSRGCCWLLAPEPARMVCTVYIWRWARSDLQSGLPQSPALQKVDADRSTH